MPINIANSKDKFLQQFLDNMIKKYGASEFWRPQDFERMKTKICQVYPNIKPSDIKSVEDISVLLEGYGYDFSELDKMMSKNSAETPYSKFFRGKLDEYGVSSPAELSESQKSKLFSEVETEWSEND